MMKETITKILEYKDDSISKENANLNGRTTSAKQTLIVGEVLKEYASDFLSADQLRAFNEGFLHIHDFDHYALGTTTCTQIRLDQVLKGGFTTNGNSVREASTITVAMAHAAIIMQANQNQQHGGQAYPNWDFDLAPYVEKSYIRHFNRALELDMTADKADEYAKQETYKETYSAAEAFIHNMNTMNGSRGGQSVFSSINMGLDTSWEGRMLIECTIKAMINGIGYGQTAVYPILIFKVKDGINFKKGDPNYDLYKLAHYATTKCLFPNYVFCDSSFHANPTGDLRNEISIMGCRTCVFDDTVTDNFGPVGRGNNSFVTLNLPMIVQEHRENSGGEAFKLAPVLDYIDMAVDILVDRLEYQKSRSLDTFDFLYGQGCHITDGKECSDKKYVGTRLDTNTLAVGFIGLAEACLITTDLVPYDLVECMYEYVNYKAMESGLNISLLASPSEGFAEKAMTKYKAKYGPIPGLEDNKFMTNSFHVPVWEKMTAYEKVDKEAPYHKLCPGGCISYVELSSEDALELDRIEDLLKHMKESDMKYASINVPIDKCMVCEYDKRIEGDKCPRCGSPNISRVRRITGYLVGTMEKWNRGKRDEESKRVTHKL